MDRDIGVMGTPDSDLILRDQRIAFVGKLASMAKRDAAQLARRHGATVLEKPDPSASVIVVGEELFPLPEAGSQGDWFDEPTRRQIEQGTAEVITETQLWQRLGLVDVEHEIHRLYTPAMLAELLGVPVAVIRRWHRRGLIVPAPRCGGCPTSIFRKWPPRDALQNCWRRASRRGQSRSNSNPLAGICLA